jgi:squalene-hopene/tetraprenyl-beta-curcumene cyclase
MRNLLCLMLCATPAIIAGCPNKQSEPTDKTKPTTQSLSVSPAATEALDAAHLAKAQKLINDGVRFLLSQQGEDGSWMHSPAMTAMALKALLQHPDFDARSPEAAAGIKLLKSVRQGDGGFYNPQQGQATYTTAVVLMAFGAAGDPSLNDDVAAGQGYLRSIQIVPGSISSDGAEVAADDPAVGGVGYGRSGSPNLSVLAFAMDGMHETGVAGDDEFMQRGVAFLKRLQHAEDNTQPFVEEFGTPDDEGGFVYDLKGSKAPDWRSYGSMTYAGFKSMLYADVARDDKRVKAAFKWIRNHWDLDHNPNLPGKQSLQGLFYYYHMYAKALRAWGEDEIADLDDGARHNWREELVDALDARVRPDGSWVNTEPRWQESVPTLATCYSVLALQEALKK